jgi:hypothetical protein
MAIKYLAGDRLIGTAAERAAMTTGGPTVQDDMTDSSLWTFETGYDPVHGSITGTPPALHLPGPGASYSQPTKKASRLITLTDNYDEMVIDIDYKQTNGTTDMVFAGVSSFMSQGNSSTNAFYAPSITSGNHTFVIGSSNLDPYHLWRGKASGSSTDQVQSMGTSPTAATAIFYFRVTFDIPDITVKRYTSDANRTANSGTIVTATMTLTSARATIFSANPKWSHFYTGLYASGSANTYLYGFKIWENTTVPIAYSYPNLPNGAIFEESDGTGKHYMWDGTSAWNEIT